jgi:Tfp pilus assembly protein FimT
MSSFFTHTSRQSQSGFSLAEIIVVVASTAILATIIFLSFSGAQKNQALKNETENVVALIKEAQAKTLAGDGASQYGVHLQSDKAVLFTGSSYSSGASTNRTLLFNTTVTVASITLTGGGSDIVFSKLTGETPQYGTFIIKNTSTTANQKTITVNKLGLITGN